MIAVEGMLQKDAYAQAFGCKPNSAATLAGRLLKRVEVQEEIERLRERKVEKEVEVMVKARVWTKVQRMEELQGMAQSAAEEGKYEAAIRAIAEMNRMDGAYEPERVELEARGTFAALLEEIEGGG